MKYITSKQDGELFGKFKTTQFGERNSIHARSSVMREDIKSKIAEKMGLTKEADPFEMLRKVAKEYKMRQELMPPPRMFHFQHYTSPQSESKKPKTIDTAASTASISSQLHKMKLSYILNPNVCLQEH